MIVPPAAVMIDVAFEGIVPPGKDLATYIEAAARRDGVKK